MVQVLGSVDVVFLHTTFGERVLEQKLGDQVSKSYKTNPLSLFRLNCSALQMRAYTPFPDTLDTSGIQKCSGSVADMSKFHPFVGRPHFSSVVSQGGPLGRFDLFCVFAFATENALLSTHRLQE